MMWKDQPAEAMAVFTGRRIPREAVDEDCKIFRHDDIVDIARHRALLHSHAVVGNDASRFAVIPGASRRRGGAEVARPRSRQARDPHSQKWPCDWKSPKRWFR